MNADIDHLRSRLEGAREALEIVRSVQSSTDTVEGKRHMFDLVDDAHDRVNRLERRIAWLSKA